MFLHPLHSKEFCFSLAMAMSPIQDDIAKIRKDGVSRTNDRCCKEVSREYRKARTHALGSGRSGKTASLVSFAHSRGKSCYQKSEEIGSRTNHQHADTKIYQSRSISPKRKPPCRARPSTGCLTKFVRGPRALE